jgi:hypothetical protein
LHDAIENKLIDAVDVDMSDVIEARDVIERWTNEARAMIERRADLEKDDAKMTTRRDLLHWSVFTLNISRSCINRFLADVMRMTSDAEKLIDWAIACEITLNLMKSTSHSRTIRFNSAHLAQRREWSFTQHKIRSFKQCWHDVKTKRFSLLIFSAIVMWKVLSSNVNMNNVNEKEK